MKKIFLIKYGEIGLKGENQKFFLKALKGNIKRKLKGVPTTLSHKRGRFYLHCEAEDLQRVKEVLQRTFGITGFAEALTTEKNIEQIEAAALTAARDLTGDGSRFKIECRRTDKSFPLNSYEIACRLGGVILDNVPGSKVDLHNPDWIIRVEVREEVYIYGKEIKGAGGLPTGCAGRGLLLLSGGIDSPVAGYLMGKRGLDIDAIYFHTHPYTSPEVRKKVEELAELLTPYFNKLKLFVVPFTDVQVKIKESGQPNAVTLHSRAAMMAIADRVAKKYNGLCLITGESLSQVASQTAQSLRFTGSTTDLPVLRPLIGLDKEEIVTIAKKIGTFETSIQPHQDCCTIFAPKHPLIKPQYAMIREAFSELELDSLLEETAEKTEVVTFSI